MRLNASCVTRRFSSATGSLNQSARPPTTDQPYKADEVIDASRCVVTPGLINTHHHMYQSLTRAIPSVQSAELFAWLKGLYPIWARMKPEMIHASALTAMAELLLSGCTTSNDHLYLYPNGARLDDTIEAAQQIDTRFHAMRGSMSVGESAGGLPPDSVVENESSILNDSQRVVEQFHDASRYAMIRVGLAPCSPFSVSTDLMRESAMLVRSFVGRVFVCTRISPRTITMSRTRATARRLSTLMN